MHELIKSPYSWLQGVDNWNAYLYSVTERIGSHTRFSGCSAAHVGSGTIVCVCEELRRSLFLLATCPRAHETHFRLIKIRRKWSIWARGHVAHRGPVTKNESWDSSHTRSIMSVPMCIPRGKVCWPRIINLQPVLCHQRHSTINRVTAAECSLFIRGPATARKKNELQNRRPLWHAEVTCACSSGRRMATMFFFRALAGPPMYTISIIHTP